MLMLYQRQKSLTILMATYFVNELIIRATYLAFTCWKLRMEPKETVFFIVNFDHISHIILVSPLLTLNK